MNNSAAQAKIDTSIKMPDYFSCRNCKGNQHYGLCEELRLENNCAKAMLSQAIQSGQVQIILHLESGMK